MSDNPEVKATRRRKGEKPVRRAEAPVRRETSSGTTRPSSGGSTFRTTSSGGTAMPSMGKMGGCGGVIVIILIVLYMLLSGGLGGGEQSAVQEPVFEAPAQVQPTLALVQQPTAAIRPTKSAPAAGQIGQDWLIMLYQNADDQALEQDIFLDLNEAEKVGSSDRVTIVSQIDRFRGGFAGTSDWHTTRRYLLSKDDDLNTVNSELVDDPGEVNMAAGESLVDFVAWATENYPSDRTVLILSDHGLGWPGGWSDPNPGGSDQTKAPLTSFLKGDFIFLTELDEALAEIQEKNIVQKFDLIGMDACLMSQMEVYSVLQPYASYAVASEETEPGLGWAYAGFLEDLVTNPDMSAAQLATDIVDTYIQQDERIIDTRARSEFLRQGSQIGGFFGVQDVGAAALTEQIERGITLTAVDLDSFPELITQFNNFAYSLQNADQSIIASARNYAQSYTSIFGTNVPKSFIDLGHFVLLVAKNANDKNVYQAATGLAKALDDTIIAEKHGSSKQGSTGIAIYFPNSTLYSNPYAGTQSYLVLAERFARISLWDDFMAYHYADRPFKPDSATPVEPSAAALTRAPGAGSITISNVTASRSQVTIDQTTTISAQITGNNIGYIYLFVGYVDEVSSSIKVTDIDYLELDEYKEETKGVYYPDWPDTGSFTLNFVWDPIVFGITDGNQSVPAVFNPSQYGASSEEAIYYVEGIYTFSDTGEQRYSHLYFKDDKLFQVFGFKGTDDTGSPSEITPQSGDAFSVYEKWITYDEQGQVTQTEPELGETVIFGDKLFEWETLYAAAGEYVVGFLVSDLDGNLTQGYTQVSVQ